MSNNTTRKHGCRPRHTDCQRPLTLSSAAALPLTAVLRRRVLYEAGADINSADKHGVTLMHSAAKLGREDVVRYGRHTQLYTTQLARFTFQPLTSPHSDRVCVSFLISHNVTIDARDSAGRTAVHYCSEHGHITTLNRLLSAGFSPHTLDAAHWTPLHFACLGEWPMHESHSLITAALLSHGAHVNASEMSGLRPLHVCTDTPVARLLVAAGAEIEAMDVAGRRAIHYASHENSIMLVQHGAEVQPTDKLVKTTTHAAAGAVQRRLTWLLV